MATMLIFRPHQREPRVVDLEAAPWMRDVDFVLGGPAEKVPGFFYIEHAGSVHRCVALALRDRADRSLNVAATIAWMPRCGDTWASGSCATARGRTNSPVRWRSSSMKILA